MVSDNSKSTVNHATVTQIGFNFILEFGSAHGNEPLELGSIIVVSPQTAKKLMENLKESIHRYEHFIGPIPAMTSSGYQRDVHAERD